MEVQGKTAIVVGATGGMGQEVCKALFKEGIKLVVVSRTVDKSKVLSSEFGNCDYFGCDFTRPETIQQTCTQIIQKYPIVDFLFNVAGIGVYKPIEEVSESEWLDSFNINVTASYYFIKYLLPSLKSAEKSVIMNWGSGMGVLPTPGRSVYCMSKFALRGMSLSLSKEFERTKVKIVHLTLGSVLTEFGPLSLEQKKEENLNGKSYFTPDWIANKVISLIKEDKLEDEITLYPTDYVGGSWWVTNPK